MIRTLLLLGIILFGEVEVLGQRTPNDYLEFVRAQAAELRKNEPVPRTTDKWEKQKSGLRENLLRAWGGFPEKASLLQARKLGELKREGYRVEKIIFQTLPGVWMTANAYVPEKSGKMPGLLMVHGHWKGAKQDPVVQSRCIGAAKLGFFVLVVDAFGAGERGVGKELGEYHGEMTAATLFPPGLPLSGLQVYENMRAVDYLKSRSEVDGGHIGITGASGGGNQTMYAGAWDERFDAVAPVCSVGNYQAYLGAACCMCEVVPGALRFTEEWGVLGMVAPRGLMVINATRDARQFSVEQAKISLKSAGEVFNLLGKGQNLRHVVFESGHDYSEPMREAVYGWMTLHLKEQGDGAPIDEPPLKTEEPEALRCFPGNTRPDDWITIPKFAAGEARRLLAARVFPMNGQGWKKERDQQLKTFVRILGGFPEVSSLNLRVSTNGENRAIEFSPEKGIRLMAKEQKGKNNTLVVVLDLEGAKNAERSETVKEALSAGASVVTIDLRATGELAWPGDKIARAPDHTTAEWGMWIGRPLIGQWVWDVRRLLDAISESDGKLPGEVEIVGNGPAGLVALAAAALDKRIRKVETVNSLASFISDTPYEKERMGIIVPGILREVGDVAEVASLCAPKALHISGAVWGNGAQLSAEELRQEFERTRMTYNLIGAQTSVTLSPGSRK